ncbi:MAG: PrpF domain-containing protein [Acidimicrobiales bacterium]
MKQRALPAVFMRGGTSKAIMFHERDLPTNRDDWAALFVSAMGSPDPHGRQLDGMGGGVSSLSKVCVVAPSTRADADVDYTFAQVMIKESRVDYRSNCGNMSSAVGPFAVDEGLVRVDGDVTTVRIFNTDTEKIIHSTFAIEDGGARYDGDFVIPGVSGSGSPIRLDFMDPGGATTGTLLPSGRVTDHLDVAGHGVIEASLVDAANAAVFVRARDVGLTGVELPGELEARPEVLALLEAIRRAASVRMGIAPDVASAASITSVPFVCVVSPRADSSSASGEIIGRHEVNLVARVISNGQPHRALPLTISLCTAVAARVRGSVVAQILPSSSGVGTLRLSMPSGVLSADADVAYENEEWVAHAGTFLRTARRLFDGRVWVPGTSADLTVNAAVS